MITALTLSIFGCIFLYSKHRQSLEQIKKMMTEFDKLTTMDDLSANTSSLITQLKNNFNSCDEQTKMSLFSQLRRKSGSNSSNNANNNMNATNSISYQNSIDNDLNLSMQLKENQLIVEKNQKLALELNSAKVIKKFIKYI